jgi:ABC-type multidrug transport system ATPase subunit
MRKLFDKVTVLYEGRQIFFGQTSEARTYFEELGFECKIPQIHVLVFCLLVPNVNISRPRATDNAGLSHLNDQPKGTSRAARL